MMSIRLPLRHLAAIAISASVLTPIAARADEFTDRANQLYSTISTSKRSDLVLLPVVAKMQPPPAVVATVEKAMILPATSASFGAAKDWATAPTQTAVL
jgi:hypothetical protein